MNRRVNPWLLPKDRLWEHTDKHGDLIAVSLPTVGGITIHGRSVRGDKTDVWLDDEAAVELHALLSELTRPAPPVDAVIPPPHDPTHIPNGAV